MSKIKRRRLKKKFDKKKKIIVILLLVFFTISISSGYALLNSKISIKGKATIGGAESECKFNIKGEFQNNGNWPDGSGNTVYNTNVVITNNGDEAIQDWELEIKGPSDLKVSVNADVSENINGIIKLSSTLESSNYSWNSKIDPGQSKQIYIAMTTVESSLNLGYITFNGCKVYGDENPVVEPEPEPDPQIKIESVDINPKEHHMYVGETAPFTASKNPKNGFGDLVWSSSNEKVATVSADGVVTAVSPGVVTINVGYEDIKASATVTVLNDHEDHPSVAGINVKFEKTAYWGSDVIQFKITIENTSDSTINECTFKLGVPEGTVYNFWSNFSSEGNKIISKNRVGSGEKIELYGMMTIPAGYNSADYLEPKLSAIRAQ